MSLYMCQLLSHNHLYCVFYYTHFAKYNAVVLSLSSQHVNNNLRY